MLNIKEVEKLTNITKQNIRYYERQGLIFPKRNPKMIIENIQNRIFAN